MNTEPITNRCPKCQAPLPATAPQGLCPKCLLAAVSTPTEAGQPADRKPPPPIATVAAAFPQLEILELIGHGGMGVVYKARQPRLDRFVALKLLPLSLATDAAFAERFNREARVLARLNHPNIVTVYDFGQSGGFFFLLMELVDGVNLRQAMQAGRFTPQQAMMLVPKICEALQFAHDEGILHRDIKPENILLDARGRVKIADFGIAKLLGEAKESITLTASGMAVGTPHYMAPEQLEHPQDVDQRADIYSLGVVFYEMLTGELPIGRFAPPSQKSTADPRVDEVVLRALERERERRQHNAAEIKTEVEQITATPAAPAGTAAPTAPSPTPPTAPKTSLCYVTTPEYLKTFRGRYLYLYQGNGQLRLDERTLSFISGWQQVTIPLESIRALTLGEYSLTAKPVPLSYLEVVFLENGDSRTLLFTPTRSALLPVWETNKVVAEWAAAVQEAVQAATRRTLELSRVKDAQGRSWREVLRTFELTAALCSIPFLLIPIFVEHRPPNRWTDYVWGPLVTALTLGSLLVMRWLFERRALRKGSLSEITKLPMAYDKDDPILFRDQESVRRHETAETPIRAERRSDCYFSTPERMRNCFPGPAAHIFLCKGELRLDAGTLRFVSPWQTEVVIGLDAIQDLSIGQFKMWHTPWVMKYERLNYLAVTFTQDGQARTVHLTPKAPGTTSASGINADVATWFKAVQEAAIASSGKAPRASEPTEVSVSAQPGWNRKGVPLFAAFLATWGLLLWRLPKLAGPSPDALTIVVFVAMLLLLIASVWFSAGFLQANSALRQANLDAVTSDDPPTPELVDGQGARQPETLRRPFGWTFTAWGCLVIGALALIETLASLYMPPYRVQVFPGLGHLLAGIALLTLSRRWRVAALAALAVVFCWQSYFTLRDAILSPVTAGFGFPFLKSLVPSFSGELTARDTPLLFATSILAGLGVFAWPCYLMLSATGRQLFHRSSSRVAETTHASGHREARAVKPGGKPPGTALRAPVAGDETGGK